MSVFSDCWRNTKFIRNGFKISHFYNVIKNFLFWIVYHGSFLIIYPTFTYITYTWETYISNMLKKKITFLVGGTQIYIHISCCRIHQQIQNVSLARKTAIDHGDINYLFNYKCCAKSYNWACVAIHNFKNNQNISMKVLQCIPYFAWNVIT